jgi:hypothetical protein
MGKYMHFHFRSMYLKLIINTEKPTLKPLSETQSPPTQVDSLDVHQTVRKRKSGEDIRSLIIKRPKSTELDGGPCGGESIIEPDLDPQDPSTGEGQTAKKLLEVIRKPRDDKQGWKKWKSRGHCCECDQQCEFYNARCFNCGHKSCGTCMLVDEQG